MQLVLKKLESGVLAPADPESSEQVEIIKIGTLLRAEFKKIRPRNYKFHQKWFRLVQFAFDHWEPGELPGPKWKGVVPEKVFDGFRKDLTILAGYYHAYYRLDGTVRVEAASISFASMQQGEFEKLYSATVDVVLKHVLKNYTRTDVDEVVNKLLGYL